MREAASETTRPDRHAAGDEWTRALQRDGREHVARADDDLDGTIRTHAPKSAVARTEPAPEHGPVRKSLSSRAITEST
jgi:hypothetical protein